MNVPAFLMVADRADGPVSPTLIFLIVIAAVLAILIVVLDARRTKSWRTHEGNEYAHALDTVRMSWLEDYDAQIAQNKSQWAVIVGGRVIGVGRTLRDAIDNARITQ